MLEHQFYRKYSNTPLAERFIPLNITKYGLMNLSEIYKRLKELDERIRPYRVEIDDLLSRADWFYAKSKLKGGRG